MSEVESDDAAFQAWAGKLSQSSAKLAAGVSAEVLAEEFGALDEATLDDLCSDAIMVAFDEDCHEVSLSHFKTAYEGLGVDGESAADPPDNSEEEVVPEPSEEDRVQEDPSTDDEDSSADPTPDPSEMDRDALEAEVEELRERVDEVEAIARDTQGLVKAVRRQMAAQAQVLVGAETVQDADIDPAGVTSHHEQLSTQAQRLDDVESEVDALDGVVTDGSGGKASKVHDIARLANNRRSNDAVVLMDVSDIVDATGVSRRYAYDLVDDLPDEYGWLHDRSDLKQYGELELDKDKQVQALVVDFDGVHGPACPVNKFTTGGD